MRSEREPPPPAALRGNRSSDSRDVELSGTATTAKHREERKATLSKVVIRRLPPGISKEQLEEQLHPLPAYDYFEFCTADPSLFPHLFSRAYINFRNPDDIILFRDRFDGFVFIDNKGQEYPAVVEFAPFQKISKKKLKKKDTKAGSIADDLEYKKFLENYCAEEEKICANPETLLGEIEAKTKELIARRTTPLLEFIKNRKLEKQLVLRSDCYKHFRIMSSKSTCLKSMEDRQARTDNMLQTLDALNPDTKELVDLRMHMSDLEAALLQETRIWLDLSSLQKYVSQNMIPRGLRLKKFPTTIYSDLFKTEWQELLSDSSMKFVKLIIRQLALKERIREEKREERRRRELEKKRLREEEKRKRREEERRKRKEADKQKKLCEKEIRIKLLKKPERGDEVISEKQKEKVDDIDHEESKWEKSSGNNKARTFENFVKELKEKTQNGSDKEQRDMERRYRDKDQERQRYHRMDDGRKPRNHYEFDKFLRRNEDDQKWGKGFSQDRAKKGSHNNSYAADAVDKLGKEDKCDDLASKKERIRNKDRPAMQLYQPGARSRITTGFTNKYMEESPYIKNDADNISGRSSEKSEDAG